MLLTIALSNSSARGDITHPGSKPAIMKVMVEHGFIMLFLIAVSSSTMTSRSSLRRQWGIYISRNIQTGFFKKTFCDVAEVAIIHKMI